MAASRPMQQVPDGTKQATKYDISRDSWNITWRFYCYSTYARSTNSSAVKHSQRHHQLPPAHRHSAASCGQSTCTANATSRKQAQKAATLPALPATALPANGQPTLAPMHSCAGTSAKSNLVHTSRTADAGQPSGQALCVGFRPCHCVWDSVNVQRHAPDFLFCPSRPTYE